MSDITTFDHAVSMIRSVSKLTDREINGNSIVNQIQMAFLNLKPIFPVRALYFMWRNPWMAAANSTFIHCMMGKIGLVNILSNEERYPELPAIKLKELNPELVLLSTEPFPFSEKHIAEIHEVLPKVKILIVDGEMFSWYGSRLLLAPAYFNSILE